MTLVNRVSAFFLVGLAVVLAGYSLLAYAAVRYYLYHRFDAQLQAAFNTLIAAVEVEEDDVKFEPTDHTIRIGVETDTDDIRWAIYDEQLRLVEHSQNLTASDAKRLNFEQFEPHDNGNIHAAGEWRMLQHHVAAPHPKPAAEREPIEHAELLITVARSNRDLRDTLSRTLVACIVLPSVIWLAAAAAGQWYCRRALAPVAEMAAQARAIKPGDAEVRIAVATSGDELADLGGAMNDLLSRLFDSLERQRRFAGDAAHQLRTPLTVLLGQIEVALRRERPVEEYKATLDVLREQTEELRQLIESLLFLARAESDAAPLDQQELSFDDWLPHYLERWRDHPRRDDLQVEVAPLLHLKTSPALLAQLLDNLLSNAFKYSAAGTPVKLSCAASGQGIAISVADRGMGISPDDRAAILRPFYRATAARQSGAPGTGLGLAICDCIVRTLGGKLDWHSEVGHGTTFTVVL